MPNHPIGRFHEWETAPALGEAKGASLLRATRRDLLTVYTPQQTAIWLTAHMSGDPVAVARKARRLRGIDDGIDDRGTSTDEPTPPAQGSSPPTRELRSLDQPYGEHRDELPAALQRIVDLAARTIGSADHITLTLAPDGPNPTAFPPVLVGLHEATLEGPGRDVLAGRVVASVDLRVEKRWPAFTRTALERTEVRSLLTVPAFADGRVVGALHLHAEVPDAFGDRELAVATLLASEVGVVVDSRAAAPGQRPTINDRQRHERATRLVMEQRRTDERTAIAMLRDAAERIADERVAQERIEDADERSRHAPAPGPDPGPSSHTVAANSRGDLPPSGPHGTPSEVDACRSELSEAEVHEIVVTAVRNIFLSEQPEEIQAVLLETVHRLGGSVSTASKAGPESLAVELSLRIGESLVASPGSVTSVTGERLQYHLPRLVEDARHAIDRVERSGRLAADAESDALTGLLNRRAYERLAGRLRAGDVLILIDLDDFKVINDDHGHIAGDQVLRVFGSVLRDQIRITEHAVRLGGDEFLIVLEQPGDDASDRLLERLTVAWRQRRPLPVTFSAGAAEVTTRVDSALQRADRALYDQKHARIAVRGTRAGR